MILTRIYECPLWNKNILQNNIESICQPSFNSSTTEASGYWIHAKRKQGHHHNGDQAHLIARPWVPISSPMTNMVYRLPFLSYLAGSKGVSARPADLDTVTNTALEAIVSLNGKKGFVFWF